MHKISQNPDGSYCFECCGQSVILPAANYQSGLEWQIDIYNQHLRDVLLQKQHLSVDLIDAQEHNHQLRQLLLASQGVFSLIEQKWGYHCTSADPIFRLFSEFKNRINQYLEKQ